MTNESKNSKDFIKEILKSKVRTDISPCSLWLKADDSIYYDNISIIAELMSAKVVCFPTQSQVLELLQNTDEIYCFLAPYHCFTDIRGFVLEVELENFCGVLTSQEKALGISKAQALSSKLGISVIESPYKLSDVGGAEKLKRYVERLTVAENNGFRPKGIFLVGIPGTGKTFFPTCLAGELNRPLVILNLEVLKESGEPINRLNQAFEYLNSQNEKFILLLDEIEKMVGNADDPLTGRLMTILSALGDRGSEYPNLQILLFATANSLEAIIKNQPAFLRRGRFDELFFVNLPSRESAQQIFQIYVNKYDLAILWQIFSIDDLMAEIEKQYRSSVNQPNRFPYTPAEIEAFLKRLRFLHLAQGEISKKDVLESVELVIPIVKSATSGIDRITAQKDLFVEM